MEMDSNEPKPGPMRVLDAELGGGLKRGELGLVISRHGVGKTPFLVGVALDRLLRGMRVIHVSLDHKVEHVRDFYDEILDEIAKRDGLNVDPTTRLELERARRIHAYLANSFSVDKMKTAVSFGREHAAFDPDVIIVDGFDFVKGSLEEVGRILDIAKECRSELWMTAVRHRHEPVTDSDGIPSPVSIYKELAALILDLQTADGSITVRRLRPRPAGGSSELPVVLDPTTMLLRLRSDPAAV